jgi:hypothetical protein
MASRIYTITDKKTFETKRFVRDNTMNAAVRAYAEEIFLVGPSSAEEMVDAAKKGALSVLDAVAPEQLALGGGFVNE